MIKSLVLLKELQQIDNELRRMALEAEQEPQEIIEAEAELARRKEAAESNSAELLRLKKENDAKSLELEDLEEKITKLKMQLNTIKTNKEYSAMRSEIAGMETERDRLEDEILELMTKQDEAEEQVKTLSQQVVEQEAVISRLRAEREAQLKENADTIEKLRERREQLRSEVDKVFLVPYERLLHRKDGIALVSAADGICQGCYMNLTPQTTNLLMTSNEPVYCHSCGRMLYLENPAGDDQSESGS